MNEIREELIKIFEQPVLKAVISAPAPGCAFRRVNIRRVRIRGEETFQFERLTEKQAFHENVPAAAAAEWIAECMQEFRQLEVWTENTLYSFRISKKGKLLSNRQKLDHAAAADTQHNRKKQYLLPEGTVIEPLIDLGVFTRDGKLVKSMTDKYRQIERFIEMIEDAIKEEPRDRTLRIVDFGCGKSYLTFVLYYYLTQIRHQAVDMTGLDLKEDVIRDCQAIAEKYGYRDLHFLCGDIADFRSDAPMDMVISLHACDTATDFALYNAVQWKSRLIFSVPCCQHEVNGQLQNSSIPGITEYGILKERLAAIVTDGLRSDLLKAQGYQVQMLEFIDMEHSPKNILIRARYTGHKNEQARKNAAALVGALKIRPTLYTLLEGTDSYESP